MIDASEMTEGRRMQFIHDNRRVYRKYNQLSREERRFVLDGLALGVNEDWILTLIEDVKELRRRKEVN